MEWWEDFFTGMVPDLWRAAVSEKQTRAEADFVERLLQLPPCSKILDVPCGNGRHTLELAARGYSMTGVDFSPAFLDEARSRAADQRLQVTWERMDMRALPWDEEFDGAFCLGGSFGYFDDAGDAAFLQSVARALKPGARFVLDATRVAEIILPNYREREWTQVGEFLFLEENRYDHETGRMQTGYTLVRDGQVEKKTDSVWIPTYREICLLLSTSGFGKCQAFGSFEQEPFKFGSPMLYLVATKA